ncbi:hypothetical protein D3C71_1748940 [compost metagenome]
MFAIARSILCFTGIDKARHYGLLLQKSFHPVTPHVPAVRIGLDALFVKRVNMNVFLILEGLQQPAQTIADRRLLRHRAVVEQLPIARFIVTQDHVQLIHLATGSLDQVNMTGVQRVKFTKHHADLFLTAWELQAKVAVQRLQFLGARTFDFVVQ